MELNQEIKDKIYFVIPAYNESKVIGDVLCELIDLGYNNIIVVDDGSSDNTYQIVSNYDVVCLRHVINRGQGAALKTGIDYAIKKDDCEYICTFDSDGQHRISDLKGMIKPLLNDECEIVLGSRFLKRESKKLVPLKKRILLKGSIFITMILSRIKLTDTHNGYRVMKKSAAKKIDINFDGFEHASEIIDEISRKKLDYKEVPVHIDYTEYSKQKGQKIRNAIRILIKMILNK